MNARRRPGRRGAELPTGAEIATALMSRPDAASGLRDFALEHCLELFEDVYDADAALIESAATDFAAIRFGPLTGSHIDYMGAIVKTVLSAPCPQARLLEMIDIAIQDEARKQPKSRAPMVRLCNAFEGRRSFEELFESASRALRELVRDPEVPAVPV